MAMDQAPVRFCVVKGRVGACDHQEDARMVETAQQGPPGWLGEVIGQRQGQHCDHGHAVNRDRSDLAQGSDLHRQSQEDSPTDQGQGQAGDMHNQIGALGGGRWIMARRKHDLTISATCVASMTNLVPYELGQDRSDDCGLSSPSRIPIVWVREPAKPIRT
jgi:hypothetical protein